MTPPDPDTLSDEELLRAYQRTTGEQDDVEAETLLKEIERRELDI